MLRIIGPKPDILVRAAKRTIDDMKDGLVAGVDAVSVAVATHARDDHPSWMAGLARIRNPDGSQRFFTRTKHAVSMIQEIRPVVVKGGVVGGVSWGAEYAGHLEFGSAKRKPYPALGPAGDAVRPRAGAMIRRALAQARKGL